MVTVGGVFQDKCYADILGKKKYFTKEGWSGFALGYIFLSPSLSPFEIFFLHF